MYQYKIFDVHCDTLCCIADRGGNARENEYNTSVSKMLKYRAYTQVYACFIAPEHTHHAMARFNRLADCFDAQDFTGIRPVLSVEGGEMIQSVEDVEYLSSCGVRCIALTWNHANRLAGGAEDSEQGLTAFGRAVVRKMNELGILIDVSHLNDKSFYDVERVNTGVLIATHSNARAVCGHKRNLPDDMFRIIRDTGGAAGINLYPPFLTEGGRCTTEDVLRHIDRFLSLGGENHIGIGADFDGTDNILPEGIRGCGDLYKIFDALSAHGYSSEQIEKISYRNFERIFFGG